MITFTVSDAREVLDAREVQVQCEIYFLRAVCLFVSVFWDMQLYLCVSGADISKEDGAFILKEQAV